MVPKRKHDARPHSVSRSPESDTTSVALTSTLIGGEAGELAACMNHGADAFSKRSGLKPVGDNKRNIALISEGLTTGFPADDIRYLL